MTSPGSGIGREYEDWNPFRFAPGGARTRRGCPVAIAQEFPGCSHLRFLPTRYEACPICKVDKRVRGRITSMKADEKEAFIGMRKRKPNASEGMKAFRKRQREGLA
jgi:hypothetical protein